MREGERPRSPPSGPGRHRACRRGRGQQSRQGPQATRSYGPDGIPIYWIVNLVDRCVEVYSDPRPDGYALRVDYAPGADVPLVIEGTTVDRIAVADMLP